MHKIKRVATTSQAGPRNSGIYECTCGARQGAMTMKDAEEKIQHQEHDGCLNAEAEFDAQQADDEMGRGINMESEGRRPANPRRLF